VAGDILFGLGRYDADAKPAVTPVMAVPVEAQRVASATTRSVTACVVLPLTNSSFIARCLPSV
jgi:hypothetical protein